MLPVSKFVFSAESDGLALEVRVNDIPLFDAPGARGSISLPLNDFLIEGTNQIAVRLRPPLDGTPASESATARVTVHENDVLVYIMVYPPPLDPPEPLPCVEEGEFLFDAHLGLRPWERGEPLDRAVEPSPTLLDFLRGIEQAMGERDIDQVGEIFEIRSRDRAAVHGSEADAIIAEMRDYYAGLFRDPFWGMGPFDASQVTVRICGRGRLALVKDIYGEDPLRSVPDAEGITNHFPLAISRLDGKWTVVL